MLKNGRNTLFKKPHKSNEKGGYFLLKIGCSKEQIVNVNNHSRFCGNLIFLNAFL